MLAVERLGVVGDARDGEGVDLHALAGLDGKNGFRRRAVVAKDHGLRCGLEMVIVLRSARDGKREEQRGERGESRTEWTGKRRAPEGGCTHWSCRRGL